MHRDSRVSQSQPLSSCLSGNRPVRRYMPLRAQALGDLASCSEARKELDPCLRELLQLSTTAVWGSGWLLATEAREGTATSINTCVVAWPRDSLPRGQISKENTQDMDAIIDLFSCRLRHLYIVCFGIALFASPLAAYK